MPWPPMQILPAAKPLQNKDLASCNTSGSTMVKTLLTYFRYSFILSSCYGFLLTFGFIMMTPQLFINYKWVFSIYQSYLKLARDFFGGRFSLGQHRVHQRSNLVAKELCGIRCRSYLLLIRLLYSKRYTPTATHWYCYYIGKLLNGALFRITATAGTAIPFLLLQKRLPGRYYSSLTN